MCIYKLIYGVGLEALRNLFMDINPTWSNQPSDAAALDRGKMKLTKDDEVSFNKGNIQGWDFSLITSILLFSNTCAPEMKRRPGYDFALKELKKCRNKVLGHPSTDKMSDADFNHYWHLLSTHFRTVGADPNAIAEIKLQSGSVFYSSYLYELNWIGGYLYLMFFSRPPHTIPQAWLPSALPILRTFFSMSTFQIIFKKIVFPFLLNRSRSLGTQTLM